MSQRATNKKIDLDGCPGLTPVILATWEVDIGNILILGQPRQKSPQWKTVHSCEWLSSQSLQKG
jgi:hypothetical protein